MINLIGYSENELKRLEKAISYQCGNWDKLSAEQQKDYWLLSVYKSAIACLAYGEDFDIEHHVQRFQSYCKDITREEIETIWKAESEYFNEHVTIQWGCYTDGEGCTYNSLIWH